MGKYKVGDQFEVLRASDYHNAKQGDIVTCIGLDYEGDPIMSCDHEKTGGWMGKSCEGDNVYFRFVGHSEAESNEVKATININGKGYKLIKTSETFEVVVRGTEYIAVPFDSGSWIMTLDGAKPSYSPGENI